MYMIAQRFLKYMMKRYDISVCPNEKTLSYTSTTKDGYRKYKSSKCDCANCPLKEKCTTTATKVIQRHFWERYIEKTEDIRHSGE